MSRALEVAWKLVPPGPFTSDARIACTMAYEQAEKDIKDALLEWLDGKLTIEGATEGFIGGYDSALQDVIDKLNSI